MKVYLVGTGPGDPELLTLKAVRIIGMCDVLVYDDLIPPEILGLARRDTRMVYVGKRSGKHSMKQKDINKLLVDVAKKGNIVARLKGGDPCIFGRGGEEGLYLNEHDIPFEIIPGISSATAGPISAGIPPTHRSLASSVKIITAHEDPTKTDGFLDWSYLAKDKGTLVFLMGASRIKAIADRLVKEGMPSKMPCALIQDAATGSQRRLISTLEGVGAHALSAGITSPCIMVIGKVVSMEKDLYITRDLPLKGRSVLITRPRRFSWSTALLFSSYGAKAYLYPLIEISDMDFGLPEFESYDMFIFTSRNAVDIFLNKIFSQGLDARVFRGKEIVAIGPKTKDALMKYGLISDIMADSYTAEGIMKKIVSMDLNLKGIAVCIPRAKGARHYLVDALEQKGAHADEVILYESRLPQHANRDAFVNILSKVDTVTFTSPSGVKNAFSLLGRGAASLLKEKVLVAIGPITGYSMKNLGISPDISAKTHTDKGMIDAIRGV